MIQPIRTLALFALMGSLLASAAGYVAGAEPPQFPLIPVDEKVLAERIKSLAEEAPEGAKLVAFLDCGSQVETTKESPVGIRKLKGDAYQFRADDVEVSATQPTIFFDSDRVLFELSGIDRTGRYVVGLTWWDFDAGGRAQTVMVASDDKRHVRIAVPTIGLPNYMKSKKGPAQKQFRLPATFAKDGKMQLAVIQAAGPNAVISELWIWQVEK